MQFERLNGKKNFMFVSDIQSIFKVLRVLMVYFQFIVSNFKIFEFMLQMTSIKDSKFAWDHWPEASDFSIRLVNSGPDKSSDLVCSNWKTLPYSVKFV